MKEKISNKIQKVKKGKSFYDGELLLERRLPTEKNEITSEQEVLSEVLSLLENDYEVNSNLKQGIFYFLAELVINIVEHAQADRASLKVFKVKKENNDFLEFLITDNGIGIKNSFLRNKFFVKNDKEALKEALEGTSAKGEKTRGFGVRTSKQIVSEGFEGKFLLLSGKAAFYKDKSQKNFLELSSGFSGTIVDCLISLKNKGINIYNYIE